MRAVVQRVSSAQVSVAGATVGEIDKGLLVLLGVAADDTAVQARWLAEKVIGLRIFPDDDGKMNLGLEEIRGELLVVSQFTLLGDCQKGRRPSFVRAAAPHVAETLYQSFCDSARLLGVQVATGRFGAEMRVTLCNEGPVTLIVESPPQPAP